MKKKLSFLLAFLMLTTFTFSELTHASSQKNNSFVSSKKKRVYKNKSLEKRKNKVVYRTFLDTSVPYIGATSAHSSGLTGKDTYIVVIDSGVNSSHPSLSNKVALQACFTVQNSCPNRTNRQIGSNAAAMVDWHGTHVSAIATAYSSTLVGVAPDAKLIAVNVFDKDDSSDETSIVNALNWVASLSPKYNIAAVNMSLGTSRIYKSTCDTVSPTLTTAIHKLYNLNIPVVVAAGNSYSLGMSNPACISKVVSVSAMSENGYITSFSNISKDTTFAAPGFQITSAAEASSLRVASGTSMAAPHVAGVFALYKQLHPNHSISLAIDNLKSISNIAKDPYSTISISSINVSRIRETGDTPPSTTTTVPTSISPPDNSLIIPTTSSLPIFKPYLSKVYSSGTGFYIKYSDSFAPKHLVSHYVLDCSTSKHTIPLEQYTINHTYFVSSPVDFLSCTMYAVMKDNSLSATSTPVYVTKG